jgi:predicted RNA-binding Zn-ribbon protein involved in translation (DUF1610 family)
MSPRVLVTIVVFCVTYLPTTSFAYNDSVLNQYGQVLLVGIAIIVVVALIVRELVCWYWKQNKIVALLTEVRDLLASGMSREAISEDAIRATCMACEREVFLDKDEVSANRYVCPHCGIENAVVADET